MVVIHRGHTLSQVQLDAIVPVMNNLLDGKISKRQYEGSIDLALIEAGCPVPLAPTETGVGTLCAPGPADSQVPAFLLRFEDHDRPDITFFDREEARGAFARAEALGWNCFLFELMKRHDPDSSAVNG